MAGPLPFSHVPGQTCPVCGRIHPAKPCWRHKEHWRERCGCGRCPKCICCHPAMANSACWRHGGKSGKGVSAGNYRHGRDSKYLKHLPSYLKEAGIKEATDAELLSLRDEAELATTRISANLKEQKEVRAAASWAEAKGALETFVTAVQEGGVDGIAETGRQLQEILKSGAAAEKRLAVLEVRLDQLLDQKTRTVAAEWKRIIDLKTCITMEEAMMIQDAWIKSAKEAITDKAIKEALQRKPEAPARFLLLKWVEAALPLMPRHEQHRPIEARRSLDR